MIKVIKEIYNNTTTKAYTKVKSTLCNNRGAIGKEEIIGIAITLIVATFILIPQFRNFATTVIDDLNGWWTNTISPKIFPTI